MSVRLQWQVRCELATELATAPSPATALPPWAAPPPLQAAKRKARRYKHKHLDCKDRHLAAIKSALQEPAVEQGQATQQLARRLKDAVTAAEVLECAKALQAKPQWGNRILITAVDGSHVVTMRWGEPL